VCISERCVRWIHEAQKYIQVLFDGEKRVRPRFHIFECVPFGEKREDKAYAALDADCIAGGYKISDKGFFVLFLRVLKKATL